MGAWPTAGDPVRLEQRQLFAHQLHRQFQRQGATVIAGIDGIGSSCGLGFARERQGALPRNLHQGQGNELRSVSHGIHPAGPHHPARSTDIDTMGPAG